MLRTMIITLAAMAFASPALSDTTPPVAVEVPANTAPAVLTVTGTVMESSGASDMHPGFVSAALDLDDGGVYNVAFSDILFPTACMNRGDRFYIVIANDDKTKTVTCGEPTK